MKRYVALIVALLLMLLVAACNTTDIPLDLQNEALIVETPYTGQGMTNDGPESVKCDPPDTGQDTDFVVGPDGGYLKWILTANDATFAKLIGPWGEFDMIQAGGGAWHKATDYYPLDVLLAFPVKAVHDGTGNVQLTVSNGCASLQGRIEITKTAVPSFTRTHKWLIDKWVETENGHTIGEEKTPKIWLYTNGDGDEMATWKVKVDYNGYVNSAWNVAGVITVKNTGALPATVTSVIDRMETYDFKTTPRTVVYYNAVQLNCTVTLPHDLAVGEQFTCTYSQDVTFDQDAVTPSGINKAGAFGYFATDMNNKFNESTGPVSFAFTTPTTEVNEKVNVQDISALFGTVALGEVTAPNGDTFTYTKDFAWADYGADNCGHFEYDNTATIVETEQSASATLKVNVQCYNYESAWAMGTGASVTVTSFCEAGFSNWGWTNKIGQPYTGTWNLYAGAGQCDPDKGTLVGTVKVTYNGGLTVEFNMDPGYLLKPLSTAVFADKDPFKFPELRNGKATTAPGQYYIAPNLSGDIWVIAHGVVGIPDPNFGPE